MNAHRIETILTEDGTLTLRNLPFKPGTSLEVIVLEQLKSEPSALEDSRLTAEWLQASRRSLQEVWDNDEDAVYDTL